jgi:threonylcarbamoyladenosine tRNA methylthiotransferase MtaB
MPYEVKKSKQKMQKMNIKTLSFGCRLNALESEKIAKGLKSIIDTAILVNTCSVTGEAERQSAQTVRKLSRENPNAVIFVTGCGATRNPGLFSKIPHVIVIDNADKMDISKYKAALKSANFEIVCPNISMFKNAETPLSKQFVQIQNGCNHDCTYCVTRLLRGPSISFSYSEILNEVKSATNNGFYEIVLTGVDTASYVRIDDGKPFLLSDICACLLKDVPEMQRLRLSSIDPASPEILKIIDLMKQNPRFMPHLHLSMQSGSDSILTAMRRRHNAEMLRNIVKIANTNFQISFSADIICGFPGETDELFNETADLIRELNLIHVHAFPFSPRPNTVAATMPNQIPHETAKKRVKIISEIADINRAEFMKNQIGKIVSILVEEKNIGRTPDDIDVKIDGGLVPNKTICDVKITGVDGNIFTGIIVKK